MVTAAIWGTFKAWAAKKAFDLGWSKIGNWLNRPDPRKILILGPSGVGKTTMGELLSCPEQSPDGKYDESISVEQFQLKDDKNVQIVVLPGQPHRVAANWTKALTAR